MHVLDGAVEAFDRPLVRFRIEPTSTHGFRTSQRYPKYRHPGQRPHRNESCTVERWSGGSPDHVLGGNSTDMRFIEDNPWRVRHVVHGLEQR